MNSGLNKEAAAGALGPRGGGVRRRKGRRRRLAGAVHGSERGRGLHHININVYYIILHNLLVTIVVVIMIYTYKDN